MPGGAACPPAVGGVSGGSRRDRRRVPRRPLGGSGRAIARRPSLVQVLQQAEGQAAEFAGRVHPLILTLAGGGTDESRAPAGGDGPPQIAPPVNQDLPLVPL